MPAKRQQQILDIIKSENGQGLYTMLGVVAGGICKKEGIYYCRECAKEDEETYGECYIHREHQLEGVLVCPHHGVYLRRYRLDRSNSSRTEFIRLDSRKIEQEEVTEVDENNIREILIQLAQMAYRLLVIHKHTDQQDVLKKYKKLLAERGFVNVTGRIKQSELYEAFVSFYGKELLQLLESDIDNDYEYNWLRVITRNSKRTVHPIRHLLFMNFLGITVENFLEEDIADYNPFGQGPWPCLNPAADHYKQDVIEDVILTMDYKAKKPVATFYCSCGFVYSRRGPDKDISNRYKIGRKKQFGEVWEAKLKAYLAERKYGLRQLARMMQCDPKTILKFDRKWRTNCFCHTNQEIESLEEDKTENSRIQTNDNTVGIVHVENHKKRIEIDTREKESSSRVNSRVNWNERDKALVVDFRRVFIELRAAEKPIRVTKTRLARMLRLDGSIDKIIDKLPFTKKYIEVVTESVRDFQIRRCKWVIDNLIRNHKWVVIWKIQRIAGIRKLAFEEIASEIEEYIDHRLKHD